MHHGDVLLATAAADALKQANPDCAVDMLVYKGMEDIVADNPLIRRVLTVDRNWKKQGVGYQLRQEYALLREIRAQGYDVVLNYSDRWRAGLAAVFSGAPVRLAYPRARRRQRTLAADAHFGLAAAGRRACRRAQSASAFAVESARCRIGARADGGFGCRPRVVAAEVGATGLGGSGLCFAASGVALVFQMLAV